MKRKFSMVLVVMFVVAVIALPASAEVCTVVKPTGCGGGDKSDSITSPTPIRSFETFTRGVKERALATAEAVRTTVAKAKRMNKK